MAIRLIALDLDGTALRGHKEMSDYTGAAVRSALDAGILTVPATGRSYRDMPREVRALPVPWFITSNGANIIDGKTKEQIYSDLIPWERAVELLRILEDFEVQPSVHIAGASVNLRTADPRVAARYGNTDYFTRRSTDNLADYVKERRQGAEKIFAIFFNEETGRALRERLSLVEGVTVTASGRDNIEINSATATKGRALKFLQDRLGIAREETAAVGDSRNDLSMLKASGLPIAMGNAEPALKAISARVCEDCDDDGAARSILRILRGEWGPGEKISEKG